MTGRADRWIDDDELPPSRPRRPQNDPLDWLIDVGLAVVLLAVAYFVMAYGWIVPLLRPAGVP